MKPAANERLPRQCRKVGVSPLVERSEATLPLQAWKVQIRERVENCAADDTRILNAPPGHPSARMPRYGYPASSEVRYKASGRSNSPRSPKGSPTGERLTGRGMSAE